MPLSGSVLATLIETKMAAEFGTPTDAALAKKAAKVIADAVVEHVTAMAVVTVAPGIPVTTAGSAAAQTGATTGPGTGTIA